MLRLARSLDDPYNDEKTKSALMMLDSECTIATLESSSKTLKPFFLNRKQEIIENLESIKKFCEVEPVHWIKSEDNSSDILTRGTATADDIGPTSVWQNGPDFFRLPRHMWPVSREFISDPKSKIPAEETKLPGDYLRVAIIKGESEKEKSSELPKLIRDVNSILSKNKKFLPRIF